MPINHVKEYLVSAHTSVFFSHFYVRASNGSHYSNFRNKCPKLGTDTPEDILFTNLAEATWSSEIRIALLHTYSTNLHCEYIVSYFEINVPWNIEERESSVEKISINYRMKSPNS